VSDPYVIPGTRCLRNKLSLEDAGALKDVEAKIVSIRDVEVARSVLPGEYNSGHLQAFHRHLFQDVYDWAGKFRTVDIGKGGVYFANWTFLDDEVSSVLAQLERDSWLTGLQRERFVQRLAYYYGELNARHPFREGNGRTQRAFLRQLAASAGWRLDWSELSRSDNIEASRQSLVTADVTMLIQVLDPVVVRI
jgi:cell filamentation protein